MSTVSKGGLIVYEIGFMVKVNYHWGNLSINQPSAYLFNVLVSKILFSAIRMTAVVKNRKRG